MVISSNSVGRLPIKLVTPITGWKNRFESAIWMVHLVPTPHNGLTKESTADTLQLRGLDTQRFIKRMGKLSADSMEEIAAAIAAVVEYA